MTGALGAVLVLVGAACLAMAIVLRHYTRGTGFRSGWKSGVPLRWRKCRTCGGVGQVWVVDGQMRVIPPRLRSYGSGTGGIFQAKIANTRVCQACGGLQRHWILPVAWPATRSDTKERRK